MLQQGTLDRYCTLLTEGMGTAQAARELGVTSRQIRSEAQNNEDFLTNVVEAQNVACDMIAHAVFQNAIKGSLSAQKFYLTNKRPSEYQEAQNQLPTHQNQIQVNIGNLAREIAQNPEASDLALQATHRVAPRLEPQTTYIAQLPAPNPQNPV